ncbi:MAG: RNA methyltransferase [Ferruginibacter sp.]|nr:RNA methyltransferase [Ferruginibacter sp.]
MPQHLPIGFINSIRGITGFDENEFVDIHAQGSAPVSIRTNPKKLLNEKELFGDVVSVPWCSNGFYLPQRPAFIFDPHFHAGAYYVQEASSMFLYHVLKNCVRLNDDLVVLDLCAAPGGKSTLVQSLLSKESILVCNEIIKSRVSVLEENLIKWGADNAIITNSAPDAFKPLEALFDLIIVDAPCSGSGMFRKDKKAIDEWSSQLVTMCCTRQKEILENIIPALKPGGILIYSTCSYSVEENEDILQWCLNNQMVSVDIPVEAAWNIIVSKVEKGGIGYRFFPDKLAGEGFFITVLKKEDNLVRQKRLPLLQLPFLNKIEYSIAENWVVKHSFEQIVNRHSQWLIMNNLMVKLLPLLQQHVYIKRAGLEIGEFSKKDLIPSHALALSERVNKQVPAYELDKDTALDFLKRNDLKIDLNNKGWVKINYNQLGLGWIKVLQTRINNYYPMAWRILKR